MKNKQLKSLILLTLKAITDSIEAQKDDVLILNEEESEWAKGGQDNCPKLDKKGCNPYGDCNGNCDINMKRKDKKKKKRH